MRLCATLAIGSILLAGCTVVPRSTEPSSLEASQNAPVAPAGCPNDPPVVAVQGANFYTDRKASIADAQVEAQDAAMIKPIQMFVLHLSMIVDSPSPSPAAISCAQGMLANWAKAGAMLQTPTTSEGLRERARFTIGLNVIALKLRAGGTPVDRPTQQWLNTLSKAAIQSYRSDADTKGYINNLYVWSGVDAASDAVLTGDPEMRAYAAQVWQRSVGAISPDGTLHSELGRGGRSLLYHQYYLSGLLMLRSFRKNLGDQPTDGETDKLKTLADLVTRNLCDSSQLKAATGGLAQETPPAYQFAVPAAFGKSTFGDRWYDCAKPQTSVDSGFGGDMSRLAAILTTSNSR